MDLSPLTPAGPGAAFAWSAQDETQATPIDRFAPAAVAAPPGIDLAGDLQGIERSLTTFTNALSRELTKLERTLSNALQSLMAGIRQLSAGSGNTGVSPNGASSSAATNGVDSTAHRGPAATPARWRRLIQGAAERNGVDPLLVSAVVRQESGFRPDAVSPSGAVGLMQLMPSTAKDLGIADPFDPAANVEGGTRLLRSLLDRYDGRLDLALAAYNAGPGAVDRFHGVPPYAETQSYVRSIMAQYRADALAQG